jgi:hypothetical protein
MLPFATEFPVKKTESRAAFVAEVMAWLHGTSYSTVLTAGSSKELDQSNAYLTSDSGEELQFRELEDGRTWTALGIRHSFPDQHGRLWRTEAVLRRGITAGRQDLLRLRTQCIARTAGAHLETPRKPYLIKSLLNSGWGGVDGILEVTDQPHPLRDNADGLATAAAITAGTASNFLPIIYISATDSGSWLLTDHEIEKLAYDLGGVAHVVTEPNRGFSFRLREKSLGRNAYSGAIGLSVPGQGIVRRYYFGWQVSDSRSLISIIRNVSVNLRSQMPAQGWEWTEIQERAFRSQREALKDSLSVEQSESLFNDFVKQLDDMQAEIDSLREQLASRPMAVEVGNDEVEFSLDNLVRLVGPEIYPGEISDRLRLAATTTLKYADNIGLDSRTIAILKRILSRISVSQALNELLEDLGRATKDPKRVATELVSLLGRHGYTEKSDNKHIRMEADDGYEGLDSITIPKTPSDSRGLKNLCKQIERTLGIAKLDNR